MSSLSPLAPIFNYTEAVGHVGIEPRMIESSPPSSCLLPLATPFVPSSVRRYSTQKEVGHNGSPEDESVPARSKLSPTAVPFVPAAVDHTLDQSQSGEEPSLETCPTPKERLHSLIHKDLSAGKLRPGRLGKIETS